MTSRTFTDGLGGDATARAATMEEPAERDGCGEERDARQGERREVWSDGPRRWKPRRNVATAELVEARAREWHELVKGWSSKEGTR